MNQDTIQKKVKYSNFSPQIYEKIEKIGTKFNLHIDQMGELYSEIIGILQGKNNPKDFIDHIVERLEIDQNLAEKITMEINKEIFSTIKSNIQSQTISDESSESSISSLERTGNFTIEKEIPSEPGYGNNRAGKDVTYADREDILAGLEDPKPAKSAVPSNLPTGGVASSNSGSENYTEPLVDYLISNPVAQGEKKVVVNTENKAPQQKPAPVQPPRKGPDQYREEIK